MNRKWSWILGVVCVPLVFGACVSQIIFDENLPLEESAHLFFYGELNITEYNGIPVPNKKILDTTSSSWRDVYLPPGKWNLCLMYIRKSAILFSQLMMYCSGINLTRENIIPLLLHASEAPTRINGGVRIYDAPPPKIGWPNKDNLIAFAPFYKVKD